MYPCVHLVPVLLVCVCVKLSVCLCTCVCVGLCRCVLDVLYRAILFHVCCVCVLCVCLGFCVLLCKEGSILVLGRSATRGPDGTLRELAGALLAVTPAGLKGGGVGGVWCACVGVL